MFIYAGKHGDEGETLLLIVERALHCKRVDSCFGYFVYRD
jgi:hypothetical protein